MISFRAKPEDRWPEPEPAQQDWPGPGFGLVVGAAVGVLNGVIFGAATGNIAGAVLVIAAHALLGFLVGCGWALWARSRT
jgi:predicted lipid-binding transport protein (Tim44 family)